MKDSSFMTEEDNVHLIQSLLYITRNISDKTYQNRIWLRGRRSRSRFF